MAAACVSDTFGGLSLPGGSILSIDTSMVTNFSTSVPSVYRYVQPSTQVTGANFCNITISYTHPGKNDTIFVEAWLPVGNWNNRFMAVGGGGTVTGRFFLSYNNMYGAIGDGYATITTDSGLGAAQEFAPWAFVSPGVVNMNALENMASVALGDEAIIGKSLIRSFYGKEPDYSYWNGCSQGGRQGLVLAQKYPAAYDGISAAAPAIYWTELIPSIQWPQQSMNMANEYPHTCELDAITDMAIKACDGLDGVVDGIIALIDSCLATFDPFQTVGSVVACADNGGQIRITEQAAAVVNATWHGMRTASGEFSWYGLNPGTDLTGSKPTSYGQPGVAQTVCKNSTCTGVTGSLGHQWLQLFVAKDPNFSMENLTHAEFDDLVRGSVKEYASLVESADPDLSRFREAGGKLITFHGLADNIIPPKGSDHYYNQVESALGDISDFYRYYRAPGLGHCFGGSSEQPTGLFEQLRAWVENGTVPEQTPIKIKDLNGKQQNRILCPHPQEAKFDKNCGDSAAEKCWVCDVLNKCTLKGRQYL